MPMLSASARPGGSSKAGTSRPGRFGGRRRAGCRASAASCRCGIRAIYNHLVLERFGYRWLRTGSASSSERSPTRRAILTRLAEGEVTVAELAAPFAMSQPAVSKHLKVLELSVACPLLEPALAVR